VVGLHDAASLVRDDDLVVVDGDAGVLVVNPDAALLEQIEQRRTEHLQDRARRRSLLPLPAATRDGVSIVLQGNIELPSEAADALAEGAEGIGLLRSEFLFLNRAQLPDEDEQYEAYREVVRAMAGRPVTIRTIDVGADKALPRTGIESVHLTGTHPAENPALGRRAIRFCLGEPELFMTQLRAILRASAHGPVRLLIPMLTHPGEMAATRALLAEARATLRMRGEPFDPAMRNGHAMPQPGGTQAFPRKQTVCDQSPRQTMQIFEQQPRLFKSTLFAGGINADQHLFNREDGCKSVHIEGGLCTLGKGPTKKNRTCWGAAVSC
jgi:phosphotransferase system enzyme I (PtsI)